VHNEYTLIELVSFDVAEARLRPNMQHFLELLQKRGLYD